MGFRPGYLAADINTRSMARQQPMLWPSLRRQEYRVPGVSRVYATVY